MMTTHATIAVIKDKAQSYTKRASRNDFIPLAIETYDCFHPCFDSFLTSCIHACIICHQQTSLVPSMFISHYRERMSIALQHVQTITIFQQTTTLNHNFSSLPHILASAPPSLSDCTS